MTFDILTTTILDTHTILQRAAVRAINHHLTLRNWLIGFYITEFEQKGQDRAKYGDKLLTSLSNVLAEYGMLNINERELRRYRLFYKIYKSLQSVFQQELAGKIELTALPFFKELSIRGTVFPELRELDLSVPPQVLLNNLSFSHFAELAPINDALKRTFYELESIKGCWNVRELKRQINSLYFERSGLSQNSEKLAEKVNLKAEQMTSEDIVKSVYVFEFLGLKTKEYVEEKDLESALLDHIQEFLLEMGYGFCFEARQKKILIGDEYFYIDLVFYHRIKCHVLIDLKIDVFNHTNAGQLNTYLNYFKNEVMRPDDNPPVGILMVTDKNEALVQYATAGMDNFLFVSKYLLELPTKYVLEAFIRNELKKL